MKLYLKKLCVFCASFLLITCGLFLILGRSNILKHAVRSNIALAQGSKFYDAWEHLPEMLPMDFYFFNWTNPEEIRAKGVKPRLEQVGPYRFMMDLKKVNVTWNRNGTLTYRQKKYWYFSEKGSNGSLDDVVTTLNIPALGAANQVKNWNFFARKGMSFTFSKLSSKLYTRRSVDELLFEGYPDELTKMASSMPAFTDMEPPKMDRFGWFYQRNGSADLDGTFTMGTGHNSLFGQIYEWNFKNQTSFYEGPCARVQGSSGINFNIESNPKTIEMFLPDFCRSLTLQYDGEKEVHGLPGKKYIMGDHVFDNGSKYPQNKCFCVGDCQPSGVLDVSRCRYGSPTFMSLPHFYEADPSYLEDVEGLLPERRKHEYLMVVEPNTGIPIEVKVRIQVNFLLQPVDSITLFEGVPRILFPVIWFEQRAGVPQDDVASLKMLLNIPIICLCVGIMMLVGGGGLAALFLIFSRTKKRRLERKDEIIPLNGNDRTQNQTKTCM